MYWPGLQKDDTYNDIRKQSLMSWLDELEEQGDYGNQCGAKLAKNYLAHMEEEINKLEEKIAVREGYLKKLKLEILELKSKQ